MGETQLEWLEPWYGIEGNLAQVEEMERELHRELSEGHPLFGLPVCAIARRCDCDDVLFRLLDGSGRVAVVHLTWTRNPPESFPWPSTFLYSSFDEWIKQGMQTDHEEFHAAQ